MLPDLCDVCTDEIAVMTHPDGSSRCMYCRTNRRAMRRMRSIWRILTADIPA